MTRIFPVYKKGMASSSTGATRPSGRHGRTFTPAGADLDNIGAGPPGIVMRTCPAIPAKTLHSPYMSAAQQKAQRVRLG